MATEYLPNQPIVFEDYSQSGLNNDESTWSVLLQDDDSLCIQQKLIPNGSDLITCELDTLVDIETFPYDTFGTGWSQAGAGDPYVHTGATGTLEDSTFYFEFQAYYWYQITFTVTAASGGSVTPYFDNYSVGDSWTGTEVSTVGTFTQYIQCKVGIAKAILIATGDISVAETVVFKAVAPCFQTPWNSYSITELGKFCHITGNIDELDGTDQVILDGYYVQVIMTVSGRTAGSVSIQTASDTSQEACTGNGTFTRYLTNTSGLDEVLKIVPDTDFNGCISDVHVYLMENTGGFQIFTNTGTSKSILYDKDSANNPVTIYKDRISWCISFNSVDNGSGLIALTTGCYKIGYYDTADSAVVYSTNQISYTTDSYEKTKMIHGDCDGEAYGFIFTNANFELWQRLPILKINPKYEIEADEYITSQGIRSKASTKKEKIKTLWVDFIDEVAHDCLSTIVNCDTVDIDGEVVYFPVQDYEPEWDANMKYNKAQVKLDMKFTPAALYNKNC
jgi:hypothetical protein